VELHTLRKDLSSNTFKELLDVSLSAADGRIGVYHSRRPCLVLDVPWSICTFVGGNNNVCE
jgi:hypothetical protein